MLEFIFDTLERNIAKLPWTKKIRTLERVNTDLQLWQGSPLPNLSSVNVSRAIITHRYLGDVTIDNIRYAFLGNAIGETKVVKVAKDQLFPKGLFYIEGTKTEPLLTTEEDSLNQILSSVATLEQSAQPA